MLKNVYRRGVGGQKRAKFGLRSFWTPQNYENLRKIKILQQIIFEKMTILENKIFEKK